MLTLKKQSDEKNNLLNFYDLALKYAAESSLHEFLKQSWAVIEGDIPFIDNWHLRAIAEHLEACYRRQIKNLLICVPPRSSKTTLVSIIFPVWCWLHNPQEKFMYASYANALSLDHSLKCRRLIESEWFQNNWGNKFKLTSDQNTKGYFDNNKKGYRIATSVGSIATGRGASMLIIDDGNNARDCESEVKRDSTNNWYSQVWTTRLNNPKNDVRIVVQQRVHEQDIAGMIIANDEKNEWVKLILPMEYESVHKSQTYVDDKLVWEDPRKEEGELLFPARFGKEEVARYKRELGAYSYAGQMQQRPAPLEGGILQKSWFKKWVESGNPKYEFVIQSWDTAFSDAPTAAYSACTTWGVFYNGNITNIILLSCWRGRVGYPELRIRATRLCKNYLDTGEVTGGIRASHTVNKVIIEAKATGDPLIRDLKEAVLPVVPYQPKGDKHARVQQISAYIEAGVVWLPAICGTDKLKTFADEFLNIIATFPNSDSRDYVDTLSQILGYLRDNNMMINPRDPKQEPFKNNNTVPYFR